MIVLRVQTFPADYNGCYMNPADGGARCRLVLAPDCALLSRPLRVRGGLPVQHGVRVPGLRRRAGTRRHGPLPCLSSCLAHCCVDLSFRTSTWSWRRSRTPISCNHAFVLLYCWVALSFINIHVSVKRVADYGHFAPHLDAWAVHLYR